MDHKVVQVEGLTKIYRLYEHPTDRAKEALSPFKKQYHKDFYALRDVSFDVSQGETLGIIGRNGSGKSTLLKILTGVSTQTAGKVTVHGKVAALLELGAGFNPEMTGVENIYLNGTMQGFSKKEIEDRMDAIIDFADIGDFIRQPVKTYSSGMFVRLAFALAINIDPDILIVDEALSVGDIFFQLKCYKKFEEFKAAGKTILFVTHDMSSVLRYCDRALVLHDGVKLAEGTPKDMVDLYKKVAVNLHEQKPSVQIKGQAVMDHPWKQDIVVNPNALDYGDGKMRIIDFGMFDEKGALVQSVMKDRLCIIRMKVRIEEDLQYPIFAMTLKDIKGNELTGTNSKIEMLDLPMVKRGEVYDVAFRMTMKLQGGQYFVSLGCTRFDEQGEFVVHHRLYDIFSFHVVATKFVVGIFDMGMEMELNKES